MTLWYSITAAWWIKAHWDSCFPKEDIQVANRYMWRYSLITGEMQMNTTMRYRLILVKMATTQDSKCCQACGEMWSFVHCWWECKWCKTRGKILEGSQKNKNWNYHMIQQWSLLEKKNMATLSCFEVKRFKEIPALSCLLQHYLH